ncbi:metallophosphoesterase family protein [Pseudarcicella hirudinis]
MQRRDLLKRLGLLTGGLSLPNLTQAQTFNAKPQRVLRIAHITDAHIQPIIGAAKGFEKCLHHIQNLDIKPDLIINSGDAIMEAHGRTHTSADRQWNLYNEVLKSENALPVISCVGNHDIWCEKETAVSFNDGKKWAMDQLKLDKPYYSFDRNGWHFIMLDSVQSRPDGSWYTSNLDEAQMDWLKKDLRNTPALTPVMIISHVPILSACVFLDGRNVKDGNWQIPGRWMHTDSAELVDLFYKHPNVKFAISGHIHLLDKVEYNGVTYCCNGAVSGNWWFGKYQQTEAGYAIIDL